jgi:hypothetical protein
LERRHSQKVFPAVGINDDRKINAQSLYPKVNGQREGYNLEFIEGLPHRRQLTGLTKDAKARAMRNSAGT